MEKIYNPQDIEKKIYDFWETNGFFKPNNNSSKPAFCIMMPPPNITGSLHMGHAFQQTIMDILIRYNRMKGYNTLWQVGTDHAGIATQILVENQIYLEENKTKKNFTRDEFIKKIWNWKKKSNSVVTEQMRRLGNSVDWDREKFTLDPDISIAVKKAFIVLYKNNFIYRKKRLVHWDSKLETVISDLEVDHRLMKGKKWFIRYPILNKYSSINSNQYLVVATTRPETLLGDTAIAVNPKDKKYSCFIGQSVIVPVINRIIPIISDKYADIHKGTGCVKITPAHDFNDYRVGRSHKLPMINIFTFSGRIKCKSEIYDYKGKECDFYSSFIPLKFQKLDILSARLEIIKEITKLKFLEKIEECHITMPYNDRSGVVINPMLTDQWYLKTSELAKTAVDAVKNGSIQFIPKKYESMYFSWMENIEDWCISRQLWWGHRIPAWYDDQKNTYVGKNEKEIREEYSISKKIKLIQDKDVLDTWFSSGLWTFSTLGWPKKTKFLKTFHSTNVLVSGFDIIFFWIARMIMLTMYFVKDKNGHPEVPFKHVFITGLIRDEEGQKMSKSKGNVIDPIDMIDGISLKDLIKKRTSSLMKPSTLNKIRKDTIKQFPMGIEATGTDALRFTFSSLSSNTRDIHWDMSRLKGYRNFCNKLWNASRFVLINTKNHIFNKYCIKENMFFWNQWILVEFNETVKSYRESLDSYRFDSASNILYNFIWNIFCDWYIEFVKVIIKTGTFKEVYSTKNILLYILESLLKLAHPIIPFITETIWKNLKLNQNYKEKTIMLELFPEYNHQFSNQNVLSNMNWIIKVIIFLRNIRINMKIHPYTLLPLFIRNISIEKKIIIEANLSFFKKIAFLKSIVIESNKDDELLSIKKTIDDIEIIIPILNIVDKKIELIRLKKEIKKTELNLIRTKNKINNLDFLKFAPKKIVDQEKIKLINLNQLHLKLSQQIKIFSNLLKSKL
ncbi:valine--tRNA ligase [Buchnera aphidicola (Muscaphis stroyani)]|uniref:Valine--tRNA ligase n=1 Tax=Buchnera aphidicola (Muscaphis stroyani) TaxID=1241869 RepID=A0A4D6YF58_9GAMM|nr:valine--tRNA ligase [Buchnera aphidicola]QCI24428.1 valine--tRNA ligase [Buchnera aphidicola (Muscaphis stroyani)]